MSLVAVLVAVALSGCGGSDEATPTTPTTQEPASLVPRALTEADAPGSKLDPVEGQGESSDLNVFLDAAGQRLISTPDETKTFFTDVGFVSALSATRFYGAQHAPDVPHIFSYVIQVGSDGDAEKTRDWLRDDALKPCPHTCAVRAEEFDVDDIDGAKGVRRSASKEDVEALGNKDDKPFDSYIILLTDGPYAYGVELQGPPGTVSEDKAFAIAKTYRDRVADLPES